MADQVTHGGVALLLSNTEEQVCLQNEYSLWINDKVDRSSPGWALFKLQGDEDGERKRDSPKDRTLLLIGVQGLGCLLDVNRLAYTGVLLELSDGQAKLENVVSSADFHAVAQEAKLEKYGLVLLTKYNVMEANGVKRSESARRGKSQDGVHSTRLWKRVCCTDIASFMCC
eukprot:1026960-Prorocentrum_minimum.AAC.2